MSGALPKAVDRLASLMRYARDGRIQLKNTGAHKLHDVTLVPGDVFDVTLLTETEDELHDVTLVPGDVLHDVTLLVTEDEVETKERAELEVAVGFSAVTEMVKNIRRYRGERRMDNIFSLSKSSLLTYSTVFSLLLGTGITGLHYLDLVGDGAPGQPYLNKESPVILVPSAFVGAIMSRFTGLIVGDFRPISGKLRTIEQLLKKWKKPSLDDSDVEQILWIGLNHDNGVGRAGQRDYFFHFAVQEGHVIPVLHYLNTPLPADPLGQRID